MYSEEPESSASEGFAISDFEDMDYDLIEETIDEEKLVITSEFVSNSFLCLFRSDMDENRKNFVWENLKHLLMENDNNMDIWLYFEKSPYEEVESYMMHVHATTNVIIFSLLLHHNVILRCVI